MCGIVGTIHFNGSREVVSEALLLKMRDSLIHRGPDGAGIWLSKDGKTGLAHRRLSIIDPSASAAQPMRNETDTVVISFNGEIYNHGEIRAELLSRGRKTWFTDHSDTEVVLRAYEEWGIDCITRFRGMFAIAVWDQNERALWLVRDRSGIKPLYFSLQADRLLFASEIKAILIDPSVSREINERSFFDYLSFLCVPAPDTLFKSIKKVPNGHVLRISADGSVVDRRYWDVLDHVEDLSSTSDEDIRERLLWELRDSIVCHKESDVPVGVFLSGGIDSSTNAALFSEGETERIKTFSIGYEGDYTSYKNELGYAKSVAARFGAAYHEKLLTADDAVGFLPDMVALQDEPIGDPVCMPLYFVSKLARDNGVVVCQVGEGADELFWGYPLWKKSLELQRLGNLPAPRALKVGVKRLVESFGDENGWAVEYLQRNLQDRPVFWGGAEVMTHRQKLEVLSPRMRRRYCSESSWDVIRPFRDRFESKTRTRHPLDWMAYLDLNFRLPELLLMRVDKMSMGVSLETRVPFLDHRFVQFAMSIPPTLKTRGGVLKGTLKSAVRGLIPDEVIDRRKQGFGAPISDWLTGSLGEEARRTLKEFCRETDLLDWSAVERLLNSNRRESAWHLFNAALWWQCYIRDCR